MICRKMNRDWKEVYRTVDSHRAEMARHLLTRNGIDSVIMNKKDSAYPAVGEIGVLVRPEDKDAAKEIIKISDLE